MAFGGRNEVGVRILRNAVLAMAFTAMSTASTEAIPLLQLDMKGGTYDPVTESIVAPGGAFELFAILTPKTGASQTDINALLNTTYYVSIALMPPPTPGPGGLGSFTFGQTGSVNNYTAGNLTYGTPPAEYIEAKTDPGDLSKHGIYPTYFAEYAFTFKPFNRAIAYNTADAPGGPTFGATGTAFYASFIGDTASLANGYNLHFDLYDVVTKLCAKTSCTDIDVNRFAPFSHDAQTTSRIPEPSGVLFLMLGSAIAAGFYRASVGAAVGKEKIRRHEGKTHEG
jgi:hypothetical protein